MRVQLLVAAFAVAAAAMPAQAEDQVLNVYNWSDYLAPDTLEKFTAATGIKVNYDVYDDNTVLEAKLMTGRSGYDIVFPSASPYFANQIKAGVYLPLDRTKIPNAASLSPTIMQTLEQADPGNRYGVPYMIAATGFGFNRAKVNDLAPGAPTDSWALLFDPQWSGKLKGCGVTLLDTATEVFPAALLHLGKDPLSQSQDDLKAAAAAVEKIRPTLRYIHSSSYINDLANGDVCLSHGYIGDLVQARARARDAKAGTDVAIVIPKEGALVNIDVMAIPKDAPHPDNAHKFINFLLQPEIIAAITNATGYANAVPAADRFVDPDIKNDPVIYPAADVQATLVMVPPAPSAFERARTRAWTRVKTAH